MQIVLCENWVLVVGTGKVLHKVNATQILVSINFSTKQSASSQSNGIRVEARIGTGSGEADILLKEICKIKTVATSETSKGKTSCNAPSERLL